MEIKPFIQAAARHDITAKLATGGTPSNKVADILEHSPSLIDLCAGGSDGSEGSEGKENAKDGPERSLRCAKQAFDVPTTRLAPVPGLVQDADLSAASMIDGRLGVGVIVA